MALPEHEDRDADIHNNGDPADDGVHVACALECLDQLCATFGAADGAHGHDHSELQIDVAKRAMFSCCDDRLANNVRQVRSDRVIPIHSHQAQRRTCNETSAYAKKAAQNPNNKADNDQIKRIDVRVGDWEKHDLSPTAPHEPEQNRGYRIQNNGLTSYEQDGDDRIKNAMLRFEPVQPVAQNMED